MEDTEQQRPDETKTYDGDAIGLRDAARAVTLTRQETPDIDVISSEDIPDRVDAFGDNKGLSSKDAAKSLTDRRRERLAEAEAFDKAIRGDDDATEAPAAEPAHADELQREAKIERETPTPPAPVQQALDTNAEIDAAKNLLRAQFQTHFPDVQTLNDIARIAATDPARAQVLMQFDQAAGQLNEVAQRQAQQAQHATWAAEQDAAFAKRHSNLFSDPKVASEIQKGTIAMLREEGVSDAEIKSLWNGVGNMSLRSAPAQAILLDAFRYRAAQKNVRNATRAKIPPVQRPGVSVPYSRGESDLMAAGQKADTNPNLRNMAKLLTAQRRARR